MLYLTVFVTFAYHATLRAHLVHHNIALQLQFAFQKEPSTNADWTCDRVLIGPVSNPGKGNAERIIYEWTDCGRNSAFNESSTSSSVAGPSPTSLTAPPRFLEFVSDNKLSTLSKGLIPKNTSKVTKWARNIFEDLKNARNKQFPEDPIPDDLFACTDPGCPTLSYLCQSKEK